MSYPGYGRGGMRGGYGPPGGGGPMLNSYYPPPPPGGPGGPRHPGPPYGHGHPDYDGGPPPMRGYGTGERNILIDKFFLITSIANLFLD